MAHIRVEGVSKSYGRTLVLNEVSFEVPPGSVTGLLGPNGAGKTTLLRLMVALGRPDAGELLFDGSRYASLPNPTGTVGCLLDPAAHHPGRSVAETVTLQARYMGVSPPRALASLDSIGLGAVRRRRFGALSLGMKQRIGILIALLGEPTHLLLDEPMNGLDIETSAWVRERIMGFAAQGGCVLISSHLLQELQSFADRIVVISRGRLAFAGGIEETEVPEACTVRSPDWAVLEDVLSKAGILFSATSVAGRLAVSAPPATVGRLAFAHQVLLEELVPGQDRSLESFYLRVTQGEFGPNVGNAPERAVVVR